MKVSQHRRDVLVPSQSGGVIEHRRKSTELKSTEVGRGSCVAVVKTRHDQLHNQRMKHTVGHRTSDAAELSTRKGQIPLRYLVADRSEAGRRPAVSWNLAYHLAR